MRLGFAAVASAAVLLAAACGDDPAPPTDFTYTNETNVTPTTPLGTVWGMVLDATDQMPLEGASVALSVGGEAKTTTTDADGSFFFIDVPAGGQAGVTITKDGYTRATVRAHIPGETGEFPAQDIGAFVGPISLFQLGGTVEVQVIGWDGQAVTGAAGTASVRASHLTESGWPAGLVTATASSQDGRLVFTGLPRLADLATYGSEITFVIEPVDADNDGTIDYVGTSETHDASWLVTHGARFTVELGPVGQSDSLSPIATNVASLIHGGVPLPGDSVIAPTEPIRVVFNQPVDEATVYASLWEEDGMTQIPATARVDSGNIVLVAPSSPTLAASSEYHVVLDVRALATTSGTTHVRLAGPFFTTPAGIAPQLRPDTEKLEDLNANGYLDANDRVTITLDQVIGLGRNLTGTRVRFPVFFDIDFDRSDVTGDAIGEIGYHIPVWANSVEAAPQQGNLSRSGFTRDFQFTMPFVPTVNGTPGYQYPPNTTVPLILAFGHSVPGYDPLVFPDGRPVPSGSQLNLMVGF